MKEMKFLLAGSPSRNSVWLHLATSGHAGVSLWKNSQLAQLNFPSSWLNSHLWLVKCAALNEGIENPPLAGPKLRQLRTFALKDAADAITKQNYTLLALSMCATYGHQLANGAPRIHFSLQGTLSRCLAVDHFTGDFFLLGLTGKAITKVVLQ